MCITKLKSLIFNLKSMKKQGFIKIGLIILLVVAVAAATTASIYYLRKNELGPWSPSEPEPGPEPGPGPYPHVTLAAEKRLIDPTDIVLETVDVTPQIPSYNLPLKTADIANFEKFAKKIQLGSEALGLLTKNGFVAITTPEDIAESEVFLMSARRYASPKDDFVAYYETIKDKDLPIFITADSLLHYYHIFFDTTLMKIERDLFYDDVWQMSKEFLADAVEQYNASSGDLKEAARRNVAYFSVALSVLQPKTSQIVSDKTLEEEYCKGYPADMCEMMIEGVQASYGDKASFKYFSQEEASKYSFDLPAFAKGLVQEELRLIDKHEGWEYSPIFIYKEDYSQYVPRGHYTKSEKLKNYFKALMWYGRMTALIKGSPILEEGKSMCTGPMDGIISEYDAKIQTLGASLIAKKFLASKDIQARWKRMYAITGFFVGFSDDLGPYEYTEVLNQLFSGNVAAEKFEENYSAIRDTLQALPYTPKIYGGLGACQLMMPCPPLTEEDIQKLKPQAEKLLEETKGFRLMGQRFTVDSWLFSEIVSPYSGEYTGDRTPRPFTWVKTDVPPCPEGREVRGFPRGLDVMAFFGSDRAKQILEDLGDTEYSDYETKFVQLKSTIDAIPIEGWFKNIYWNWLYTLKSLIGEFGQGYQTFMQTEAWQDKELTTALASWAELRHDTILYVKQSYTMAELGTGWEPEIKIVGYVEPVPEFYARLLTLTKMTNFGLKKLVPTEELENLKITYALDEFAKILDRLLEISKKELENKPLSDEEYKFIEDFGQVSANLIEIVSGGEIDEDVLKTTLIADVHTEGNTEQVLEEGVGYIKTLIAAYRLPEGHILVGVGPVFSYYEFKQPMSDRLTDEAWREMLETSPPPEPEWINSFSTD